MINIHNKAVCCGCSACTQICPRHCISFEEDVEGFKYPKVNSSICINCGLCEKVCPVINPTENNRPINVFAAKNQNKEELLASSSGGLFILLAKKTLQDNGVVFGAKFDSKWNVIHSYAETEEEAKNFMGSKYVQSSIGDTYIKARDFLRLGRKVLFTGTPCQIAGLKNFIGKDNDNLITVDFICHGVPSPKVWQKYLSEFKNNKSHMFFDKKNDIIIKNISFRNKLFGWNNYNFQLTYSEKSAKGKQHFKTFLQRYKKNTFMNLFLSNIILRPSCYQCCTKKERRSDITIADFWGVEKKYPNFYDKRGVGLLFINSYQGKEYVKSIPMDYTPISLSEAIANNPSYNQSPELPDFREIFFKKLNSAKETSPFIINQQYYSFSYKIRLQLSKMKRFSKAQMMETIKLFLPNFEHEEKGRNINQR